MPRSEASIVIDRSSEEVWAYVTEPENLVVWNSALVSAEADGPMRVGGRLHGQVKFLGKKMDYVNEVTAFDAPKRSAYSSIESPFPWHGETLVEPEGDGAKVTLYLESDNIGGFFGKLADPVVAKMYSRQMRSDLENLKEILEHA